MMSTQSPGFLSALASGVKRYVYISAADFGLINYLLKGYYEGKVLSCFCNLSVIFKSLNVNYNCPKKY
jgi:hypothetical protein